MIFSMIIQGFPNSMIFPCMELFLVIFQVFHDFQSLWEPCLYMPAVKALTSLFADMLSIKISCTGSLMITGRKIADVNVLDV